MNGLEVAIVAALAIVILVVATTTAINLSSIRSGRDPSRPAVRAQATTFGLITLAAATVGLVAIAISGAWPLLLLDGALILAGIALLRARVTGG
jgi:hypothetical protein